MTRDNSCKNAWITSAFQAFSALWCVWETLHLPPGSLTALHHKPAVDTVLSHQLLVSAPLNDFSAVYYENTVSITNGFQPMGDHDHRLIVGQLLNGLYQIFLVLWIHIGSGLV